MLVFIQQYSAFSKTYIVCYNTESKSTQTLDFADWKSKGFQPEIRGFDLSTQSFRKRGTFKLSKTCSRFDISRETFSFGVTGISVILNDANRWQIVYFGIKGDNMGSFIHTACREVSKRNSRAVLGSALGISTYDREGRSMCMDLNLSSTGYFSFKDGDLLSGFLPVDAPLYPDSKLSVFECLNGLFGLTFIGC